MTIQETEKDVIRRELELIAKSRGGLIPAEVVKSASRKSSPLHKFFTWDDTEAARRYREEQAAFLIRRIKVEIQTSEQKTLTVRAFINVREPDADGCVSLGERGQYVPIQRVLDDDEMRRQMLSAAKRELAAFRAKYAILSELTKVFQAIDEIG